MQKFCLALDLKNDEDLISQYERHHQAVWPEIQQSIFASGIIRLEIFRVENRLFMTIEANDSFSFEKKNAMDASDEKVQEWETLMSTYQQALPTAKSGEKWMLMKKICDLQQQ